MIGNTLYAFVDESGDPNLDSTKSGQSPLFVVTAVLVSDLDLAEARNAAESIRNKHFQSGEIKSSKVAANSRRRLRVMTDLCRLPIRTAQLVVDKSTLDPGSGLVFRQSFFKNINRRLYDVLTRSFSNLDLLADEHGRSGYMSSFKTYIERTLPRDFFQKRELNFAPSKSEVLIQVADMFAGTLARCVDGREDENSRANLWPLLSSKALWISVWPPRKQPVDVVAEAHQPNQDELVREYCLRQARLFLSKYADDIDRLQHVSLLELLYLHAAMAEDRYLASGEMLERLGVSVVGEQDTQLLRQLVRDLRDAGVLLASSRRGYKIPTSVADMESFAAHANSIVPPMLDRLVAARMALRTTSMGEIDVLCDPVFGRLRELADLVESQGLRAVGFESVMEAEDE